MFIHVNDPNSIATGFILRSNFHVPDYLSVRRKVDDKYVDVAFSYSRDSQDKIFISVDPSLSEEVLSVNLKEPNNFVQRESETDMQYITRLLYSFKKYVNQYPNISLKPNDIRFGFFNLAVPEVMHSGIIRDLYKILFYEYGMSENVLISKTINFNSYAAFVYNRDIDDLKFKFRAEPHSIRTYMVPNSNVLVSLFLFNDTTKRNSINIGA